MPRARRRWRVIAAAGFLVLAGCSSGKDAVVQGSSFEFVSPGGKTSIFYDPPQARGTSPQLSGEDLLQPDKQLRIADYPGKVIVLNIWGSWCGPCRAEMPHLQKVYDETKATGVQFLGIDVRDEPRTVPQDFVRDRRVTYPSIFDPSGRSLLALKGYPRNVVPSTIVLDRQHRVAAVFLTPLLDTDLRPVVQRLAAEPGGPAA